jgi:hypothetical protein
LSTTYAQAINTLQQRGFDMLKVAQTTQVASLRATRELAQAFAAPERSGLFAVPPMVRAMTDLATAFTFALLEQQVAYTTKLAETLAEKSIPATPAPPQAAPLASAPAPLEQIAVATPPLETVAVDAEPEAYPALAPISDAVDRAVPIEVLPPAAEAESVLPASEPDVAQVTATPPTPKAAAISQESAPPSLPPSWNEEVFSKTLPAPQRQAPASGLPTTSANAARKLPKAPSVSNNHPKQKRGPGAK